MVGSNHLGTSHQLSDFEGCPAQDSEALDKQAFLSSGCRCAGCELAQKRFRPSAATPEAANSRSEWNLGWANAVGGDEKDRSRHRVRGIGDEDRDQAAAHHAGLDRDPPSAAQLREHDRMIAHFKQEPWTERKTPTRP